MQMNLLHYEILIDSPEERTTSVKYPTIVLGSAARGDNVVVARTVIVMGWTSDPESFLYNRSPNFSFKVAWPDRTGRTGGDQSTTIRRIPSNNKIIDKSLSIYICHPPPIDGQPPLVIKCDYGGGGVGDRTQRTRTKRSRLYNTH